MSGRVPNCTVYVNGARVLDAKPTPETALDPLALDGLRVTWGRETTVDQPSPATLTLTLLDPEGGRAFGADWHVGALVRVEATGPQWTQAVDPTEPEYGPNTLPYGDFESTTFDYRRHTVRTPRLFGRITEAPFAGMGAWTSVSGQGGTESGERAQTIFTPGPLANPGDPPGGWDDLPRFGAATSTWLIESRYRLWHGTTRLASFYLDTPFGGGGTGNGESLALAPTAGAWGVASLHVALTRETPEFVRRQWLGAFWECIAPTWGAPLTLGPTWAQADCAWNQSGRLDLDNMTARADEGSPGADVSVIAFEGRVTDLVLSVDDEDRPMVKVTAADVGAELGNRVIGDEPWMAETVASRAARILAVAGAGITLIIDPVLRQVRVSYQDVDAQGTLDLLHTLATSVDAVLWVATHPTIGTYLRMEAMTERAPLFRLMVGADGLVRIVPSGGARVLAVSACRVLTEPVEFESSVSDVINTVSLGWLEQTVDDETGQPAPTERTIIVRDAALVGRLGTRRLSTQTMLADLGPAQLIANQILARLSVTDWRVHGLTLDAALLTSRAERATALRLLDGTARNGLPMFVTDLPGWAPAGNAASLYLEGGTYTYTGGEWLLSLTASAAQATGRALPWNLIGPYRWRDFAPEVQWQDVAGVQPMAGPKTETLTYDRKGENDGRDS